MTCNVLTGTLNPTHSLTHSLQLVFKAVKTKTKATNLLGVAGNFLTAVSEWGSWCKPLRAWDTSVSTYISNITETNKVIKLEREQVIKFNLALFIATLQSGFSCYSLSLSILTAIFQVDLG